MELYSLISCQILTCLLGTQIRLEKAPSLGELQPGLHPQDFWCRKQFYSLNCQIIGDSKRMIRNLVCQWAGSTHDSRIWRNCHAKTVLERQSVFCIAGKSVESEGVIILVFSYLFYSVIGDSAYPISRTLVKPYLNPEEGRKRLFNRRLSGIRTIATENSIGILKQRYGESKSKKNNATKWEKGS